MAVGEGAALGVLAGEADVDALGQQRGEGERLGVAEVDAALLDRLEAAGERAAQLAVDREALRHLQQRLVQGAELLGGDRGVDRGLAVRSSSPVPVVVTVGSSYSPDSIFARRSLSAADISSWRSSEARSTSSRGHDSLGDQLLGVDLGDRRVGLDLRRHQRLGVGGLVGLVVAEAAVADHVDDDVAAPALAVGHRQADRGRAGLDVVGVDVDDRDVEALRHVGRVGGRAGLLGVGGEADLVVLDDVDRAAGAVALQRLQVEGLGDDALGREGGVAVQQDRHRPLRVVGRASGPSKSDCRKRAPPVTTGSTNSRWLGFG